jgi:hypothetical protein
VIVMAETHNHTLMDRDSGATPDGAWRRRATWAACFFLAIVAFFLWTEHRAHLLGVLPYAIALACPIIHLFMHRGHHKRGHEGHGEGGRP